MHTQSKVSLKEYSKTILTNKCKDGFLRTKVIIKSYLMYSTSVN